MILRHSLIPLLAIIFQLTGITSLSAQEYTNYDNLKDSMDYRLMEFYKKNKHIERNSFQTNLLSELNIENKIFLKTLPPQRRKLLNGKEVYQLCKKSTLVVCQKGKSSSRFLATAVALTEDGICASNYHVFAEVILSNALNGTFQNKFIYFVLLPNGQAYPLKKVLATDPINDFTIFQVEMGKDELDPMPLGDAAYEGEDIYCLSHPQGRLYFLTKGIVARNHSNVNKENGQIRLEMQITADYAIGSSGGPIIDRYGNLIGLVSSTHSVYSAPQSTKNLQMTIKNTVPIKLIRNCFILKK